MKSSKNLYLTLLLLLAAGTLLALLTGIAAKDQPGTASATYSIYHKTIWGFKHEALFFMLDESGDGTRKQDLVINRVKNTDKINHILIDDIFTAHLLIPHASLQDKYLKTTSDKQLETIDERLANLPVEMIQYLQYLFAKYPGMKYRLSIRSTPLSLNFLNRPDFNRDPDFVTSSSPDYLILLENTQVTSSLCYPTTTSGCPNCQASRGYDDGLFFTYYQGGIGAIDMPAGAIGGKFLDQMTIYYEQQQYPSTSIKEDLSEKYFIDDDGKPQTGLNPYIGGTQYAIFNGFYPDYFSLVQCNQQTFPAPLPFITYFDMAKYKSFLQNFFAALYAVQEIRENVSWEILNESNHIAGYGWMSPAEFQTYAVEVYKAAKDAGFADVAIGGFSNSFVSEDIDDPDADYAQSLTRYYRDNIIPGIVNELGVTGTYRPVFSWHQYAEPDQRYSLEKMDKFNENLKVPAAFDFLDKSVITEFNLTSFWQSSTHQDLLKGPQMVHELGRLADFAARHNISQVYLQKLKDLPGQTNACGQALGFFDCDGNKKPAYDNFLKVYHIIKNGYTVYRYNKGFTPVGAGAGCEVDYIDIVEGDGTLADPKVLRVAVGYAPLVPRIEVWRQAQQGSPPTLCTNIIDEYMSGTGPCTLPTQNPYYMYPGSWQIYRPAEECPPPPGFRPIIFVPNPANCEGVEGRWEGIDLTQFNEVRFELSEVNTGQIVRLMAVNKEINKIQFYSCELRQGLHEGRVVADRQVVARGNLMVAR